jgi:hypothetical protein
MNTNNDWDNEPETLRYLWLKQAGACEAVYLILVLEIHTIGNPMLDMTLEELDRYDSLKDCCPDKEWEMALEAKAAYEAAGGNYEH